MDPYRVKIDDSEIKAWKGKLPAKLLERAVYRAGVDAIRKMKAEASRLIRERKRLKGKFIRKGIVIRTPNGKGGLVWELGFSGAKVPVFDYPVRQGRTGVSVTINKGARKIIKHAFIATMPTGHQGVFQRIGRARLHIKELYSSRVSDAARDSDLLPKVANLGLSTFAHAFARNAQAEFADLKKA